MTTRASSRPVLGVELELAGIVGRLLGHPGIGLDDDVFALGLDSLGALRLIEEVRQTFGFSLPLDGVFSYPSVAGLSLLMRGSAATDARSLVPIQPGGSRPGTYCVGPVGGSVARYFALARSIGADWPVLGLQPVGLASEATCLDTIEEIAQAYLDEVVRHRPSGVRVLMGYSFGGTVAFEMARRLTAQGQPPILVLIDAPLSYDGLDPVRYPYEVVARHALRVELGDVELAGLPRAEALGRLRDLAIAQGKPAAGTDVNLLGRVLDVAAANCRAALGYRHQPYAGRALLVRSRTDPELGQDGGWEKLVADLSVVTCAADHFDMLEPTTVWRWSRQFTDYVAEER
jgi:thioesterase domain-containing protein/acyl carrier protein